MTFANWSLWVNAKRVRQSQAMPQHKCKRAATASWRCRVPEWMVIFGIDISKLFWARRLDMYYEQALAFRIFSHLFASFDSFRIFSHFLWPFRSAYRDYASLPKRILHLLLAAFFAYSLIESFRLFSDLNLLLFLWLNPFAYSLIESFSLILWCSMEFSI